MIRVLQIVTNMRRGGLETMLMNYYRHIDRTKVQFDFLVHRNFESDYDGEIMRMGGRIYHFPRLIPWSISYRKKLTKFFINHPEYKIVHVHQDCLSSVALECAQKGGVPVRIAHSHNSNQDKNWKYIVKRYYMKYIPRYATVLFACGKEAGNYMFNHHPFVIFNNGIDFNKFKFNKNYRYEIRKELNIKDDELCIGLVAAFLPVKNHNFLIDIMDK